MQLFQLKNKKTETVVQAVPSTRLYSYEVANLQGIGTRNTQEDSFAFVNALDVTQIQKNGMMFIVADGMGGMIDGKLASETVVASMKENFLLMDRTKDIALQLKESVFNAGEKVFQVLEGNGGSTVVAGIFFNEQFYFASVGDSYLFLKRGTQLYRINREHNVLTQELLEYIMSESTETRAADIIPEAYALTQFLGMDGMQEVDFFRKPLPLQENDIILACSDGIGSVLSQQTILSCMEKKTSQDICSALEKEILAQRNKNQDNYTALVIKCAY